MAFPSHDLGWLAWIGLVPLLIGFTGKRPTYCLFTAMLCGIVFFSGIFNWILEVPGYKIYHHAILIPYLSLYFGLFGWVFGLIATRWGNTYAYLVAPFIWVCATADGSASNDPGAPPRRLGRKSSRDPGTATVGSL